MASTLLFSVMTMATLVIIVLLQVPGASAENETHMVFYMHDILRGSNVTAMPVAGFNGSASRAGKFGTVVTISDLITKRPQATESDAADDNIVGRAQGIYVNTNQVYERDFFMAFTLIFHNDEYRGSTLEFHGTDQFDHPQRELAVVGGTGKFRFARGYTIFTTESLTTPNSVVKFNVTLRTD